MKLIVGGQVHYKSFICLENEVDCGRAGSFQIIHTERMSKVRSQILRGEETLVPADDILNEEDVEEQQLPNEVQTAEQSDEEAETRYTMRGRKVRKPEWYKDFVFSLFRCDNHQMVKTKTTPRKQKDMAESKLICPVCKNEITKGQTFEEHVVGCARDKVDKLSQCEICKTTFIKDEYRRRHMKREHGKDNTERHSDWDSDPDLEFGDEIKDPCVRKRAMPKPVTAPVKVARPTVETNKAPQQDKEQRPLFSGGPRQRVANVPKDKRQVVNTINMTNPTGVNNKAAEERKSITSQSQGTQTEADEGMAICDHCDLKFGNRLMLCMHQGIHAVENPLRCNACGYLCKDALEFFSHITWGHVKN